ncbi:hypothetical protein O181_041396 [Austropuccinia psidii MF-1]|uniref:Uncharacterized protein n=1 Tax=Austropuccinia psidii MF-1 TaxID=1389203 RepID=A0A9Q3DJM0_9BASI|nr:hypothetical protein [Austropuccinia psidii MF-1]
MKMIHTRNGSNYSVQPDGCGQGRGNTKSRSDKSCSIKTCLEDARVAPILQGLYPQTGMLTLSLKLVQGNILRAEPFLNGSNKNISVPVQKMVQRNQRRGVVNMPKPLKGGHELLLTHQELSGSGEDHRTLRRVEPIFLQRQGQKYKKLVEEPKYFIHRPEGVGNDSSLRERKPSGVYQLQKCPKTSPRDLRKSRKVPRNIKLR